ncbi:MAG: hypothetical protein SF172_04255 [Burkholderiales bacterium]|nr:hypothetical protein [Burkholderiales bacterium]
MQHGEYIRNLTWIGSLVPADRDPSLGSQNEILRFLDRFVPPSRKHQGAPKGRRSSYFCRVLKGEINPSYAKVHAGESVAPGSEQWYQDAFWDLLNAAPMNPIHLDGALWRIPYPNRPVLTPSPDVLITPQRLLVFPRDRPLPMLPRDLGQLRAQCNEYVELESWVGFKCLFLMMRIAEAHKDWEQFDLIHPYLYRSTFDCLFHPVLQFSARFLSLFVLTWISTKGRCGLEAIPQKLWLRGDLLSSMFGYALPGVCQSRAFIYEDIPLLNPLFELRTVPESMRANFDVASEKAAKIQAEMKAITG